MLQGWVLKTDSNKTKDGNSIFLERHSKLFWVNLNQSSSHIEEFAFHNAELSLRNYLGQFSGAQLSSVDIIAATDHDVTELM